jgi:hypothetical protein
MTDLTGFHPELVRRGICRGVDLNELARRFWRLEAMRARDWSLPEIRWRARSSGSTGGRADFNGRRVVINLGPDSTAERNAELLLHELVHASCPVGEVHGELFRRRLIACAAEAAAAWAAAWAEEAAAGAVAAALAAWSARKEWAGAAATELLRLLRAAPGGS